MEIINNVTPQPAQESPGNGFGWLIGIVVLVLLAYVFIVYALPAVQRGMGGTTVNVPKDINVNVNTKSN